MAVSAGDGRSARSDTLRGACGCAARAAGVVGGARSAHCQRLVISQPVRVPVFGIPVAQRKGRFRALQLGIQKNPGPSRFPSATLPLGAAPPPFPAVLRCLPPASCPPASPDGAGRQGTRGHRGGGTGDSGAGRRPRQTARGLPRRVTRHVTQLGPARVVCRSCDAAVLSFKTRLQSICGRSMQQPSRRSILRSRPPPPPPPLPPPPIDALRAPVAILGGERGRQKEGPVGTGIALGSAARAGAPPPRRWEPASRERSAPL